MPPQLRQQVAQKAVRSERGSKVRSEEADLSHNCLENGKDSTAQQPSWVPSAERSKRNVAYTMAVTRSSFVVGILRIAKSSLSL